MFGYSKFSSVTTMIVELGLPSLNTSFATGLLRSLASISVLYGAREMR